MVLANIIISNETSGNLRNPLIINYLYKSVFELSEYSDEGYLNFNLEDIATLVDAYYKSQMKLKDKYGDLFVDILKKQDMLALNYLATQPVKTTLKLFRGFSMMQDNNWSEENK